MDRMNRLVAVGATFGMLFLLFAMPSARAEGAGRIQDRFAVAEAVVADPALNARLAAAARRLRPTVTVETRIGPNTSVLTRIPATLALR